MQSSSASFNTDAYIQIEAPTSRSGTRLLLASRRESGAKGLRSQVRFSDTHRITQVPSRSDLSQEEFEATWLSGEDYEEVLSEVAMTEAAMSCEHNKHLVDDELLCSRGLSSNDGLMKRKESNSFVQKLIVHQFAHQVSTGTADDGLVAKVYRDCSLPAVKKAQDIARRDEEEAMRYLSGP